MTANAMPRIFLAILVTLTLVAPAQAQARKHARKTAKPAVHKVVKPAPKPVAKPAGPADVVLMGSSSIAGPLGVRIEQSLKREGISVGKFLKSSSGICRPDFFDWRKAAAEQASSRPAPKVVVMYLGGNDSQDLKLLPNEAAQMNRKREWVRFKDERDTWRQTYEQRMVDVIDGVCAKGVRKVIVLSTVAVSAAKHVAQQEVIRDLQKRAAERSKCGEFLSTIPPQDRIPPAQLAKYRLRDGFHVTADGAVRVWDWLEAPFLKTVRTALQ